MKREYTARILLAGYGIFAVLMFLYSYTQVDLGMTLSRASVWQTIQRSFQYIGFFQRPLSTVFFVGLITAAFLLYALLLSSVRRGLISYGELRKLVLITGGILAFSFPAFSYDFFNYMFSAKTVLVYHQNPYMVTPLSFSGVEPWLSFLRWTHLTSAYTPLWILLTLPPYLLGLGYFVLIMWNIKLLLFGAYLSTVWFLYGILKREDPGRALLGTAVFAFNPLVLTEAVVSPHNDIVMVMFAAGAIYLYLNKRRGWSWLFLALSVALKMMTAALYPAAVRGWSRRWSLVLMTAAMTAGFVKKELLPWYALWVLPFVALNTDLPWAVTVSSGLSFGLLMRYAPVLYFGNYDPPVNTWRAWLFAVPVVVSIGIALRKRVPQRAG